MASINKLAIRGVRSFSPEDEEQVLEFFFPVTIIVGANGCGKTTIIESLKYAITGGLPPGANSGRSFVHDPRSIGQSTVKASVKLRFVSKAGHAMVVVRSMELSQKKATMTFRQLDGVLRTQDSKTGTRSNISHKCGELDQHIPQLMGVSKAILDYVLFCHQEDSSWPLQDSAVLKKRFDEIFDSHRYSKAIEVLRKKEKSYLSLAKDIKADLSGLNSHKHAAQGFRNELETLNESLEELEETKKNIVQELAKADEEIAEYAEKIDAYEMLGNEIVVHANELHQTTLSIQNQRSLLDEDLTATHTLSELQTMLSEFDENYSAERDEIEALSQKIRAIQMKIRSFEEEDNQIARAMAEWEAQKKAYDSQVQLRLKQIDSLMHSHTLDLDMTQTQMDQSFVQSLANTTMMSQRGQLSQDTLLSVTADDMGSFFEALEKKDHELSKNLADHKQKMKADDSDYYAAIGALKSRKDIIDNDLLRLEQKKKEYNDELAAISKRVTGTNRLRKADVEEARSKADALAKQLQDVNQEMKDSDISAKISNEERKANALKQQIDDDRMVLETLRFSAEEQQNILILKDQTAKELEELDEGLRENVSLLQKFNLSTPTLPSIEANDDGVELQKVLEKFSDSVHAKYDDIHSELMQATEELLRTQKTMSEKSALLGSNQQSLGPLRLKAAGLHEKVEMMKQVYGEIRQNEASIGLAFQVNEESPRELLNYLEERIDSLQEEESSVDDLRVIRRVMKRMMRMVLVDGDSTKMACPCCKTPVTTTENARAIQDTLKHFSSEDSPFLTKTNSHEAGLKPKYEAWKSVVASCMDDVRDYHRIDQEIRNLEANMQVLIDETNRIRDRQKKQESHKGDLEADDRDLRDLLDMTKRWCSDGTKIVEKRMSIIQKQLDLTTSLPDTGADLKTVERNIAKKLEEKEEIASRISSLLKTQQSMIGKISLLNGSVQRMEQLAREKEEKFSEERKYADRKTELNDLLRDILGEERKLQEQVAPLSNKIAVKESEQEKMRAHGEEAEERLNESLAFFRADVAELKKTNDEISKYLASDADEKKRNLDAKSKKIADNISAKRREGQVVTKALDKRKATLQDQDRKKKQLNLNIAIIEATRRVTELEREKKELERKTYGMESSNSLYDKQNVAQKRRDKHQELKFRTEGRWSEIVEQIRSLKRKLASPEYKDIDERCRKTTIEHTTTLLAAEDLKKYYTAIDKALLMFHSIKIGEINKIIRELWMMTYKGEDIANIEIVSGQESNLKAGKSYNYRVVMTKGSSEMDMRGRCSAGQRVLASIVIRLALAETFGITIGTLALDEPTVNLDHKNKQGLAAALAKIVASRSQQRNFQLVMITHDEDFVSMLKMELSSLTGFSMPEKYFQVRRERGIDGKYYSKIDAVDWDELV